MASDPDLSSARERMVREQLAARGIEHAAVLDAFRGVQRERFVPPELAHEAYDDVPLPLERGQTISQPWIVARMIELLQLRPGDRVLEIGSGSGYAAAILACIARLVFTVERDAGLARSCAERLARLRYDNVRVLHADGTLGWPAHAPYDAIVVAAGGPRVPDSLRAQLAPGGRLVMPIGRQRDAQQLVRVTRSGPRAFEHEDFERVQFVPLIGAEGWGADIESAR